MKNCDKCNGTGLLPQRYQAYRKLTDGTELPFFGPHSVVYGDLQEAFDFYSEIKAEFRVVAVE